jgi:hypothetical protein
MNQNLVKHSQQQGLPAQRFDEFLLSKALRLPPWRIARFASGERGPAEPYFSNRRMYEWSD